MKKLLFVCTGNTCRSVMAEQLFRHHWFSEKRSAGIEVSSAGISAYEGNPASAEVLQLLKEEGIDASRHLAVKLTTEIITISDLILVMTGSHKNAVKRMAPGEAAKIKLLSEYVPTGGTIRDISDPFGGDLQIYRKSMQEIRTLILKLIEKIQNFKE